MKVIEFIENLWVTLGRIILDWMGTFLPQWAVTLIWDLVIALILVLIGVFAVLVLSLLERKVAARMGDRYGPNRWGPYGIFQAVTDAIKMLTKEDITPSVADKLAFNLAPAIVTHAGPGALAIGFTAKK